MSNDIPSGKKARATFEGGFYCAESVLKVLAEELGEDSPQIPRMASAFCSGMSRTGGTCGALTGAIMALGLAQGRTTPEDDLERVYADTQELVEAFEQTYGATTCTGLLGCHLGTPEGQKTFADQKLYTHCLDYAEGATDMALKILRGEDLDV